jgi:hypothetical protein
MMFAIGAAFALALAMTAGDMLWAGLSLRHRVGYGLAHGALMCLVIGGFIGWRERRPAAGLAAGPIIGVLAAGVFYVLAPWLRYSAMFPAWMFFWICFALLQKQLAREAAWTPAIGRGLIAAVVSGIAFYMISGVWTRPPRGGPNYLYHLGAWFVAFLPGFVAMFTPLRGSFKDAGATHLLALLLAGCTAANSVVPVSAVRRQVQTIATFRKTLASRGFPSPVTLEHRLYSARAMHLLQRRTVIRSAVLALGVTAILGLPAKAAAQAKHFPLESTDNLRLENMKAEPVVLEGKKGLRITMTGEPPQLVPIVGLEFANGTIEAEIAGAPAPNAPEGARGFVGIAFRVQADMKTYDAFYLRPTNGRAEDQERRNHAAQYISQPEWPWARLRKETPSRYESYVDLVPGAWTRIKIEVRGDKARLYVHGQEQPALIVNDVKTGPEGKGGVALWLDLGTVAHFRNLTVQPGPAK